MKPVIPPAPDVPETQRAQAELGLRYEDVCQDGRLRLEGVWPPMSRLLWKEIRLGDLLGDLARRGIRNVMARMVMHAENVPISPRGRLISRACYQLAHTVDETGAVNRIVLDTWLTSACQPATRARAEFGEEPLVVARAYGQQVFTRPTAPPGQHRVTRLDDPKLPEVPEPRTTLAPPSDLFEPPPGARFLEPVPAPDTAPIVFGLSHTDMNQHVNFLTYPRCIEETALRRFADLGLGRPQLARSVEISYSKPCFAGDRMRVVAQAFELGSAAGVCAAIVPDGSFAGARDFRSFGRAHCVARLWLA